VIGDMLIVDAVVQPYNLAPGHQDPAAQFDSAHAEYQLTHKEFFSEVSFETIARAEFVASSIDRAVIYSLPNRA